MQIRLLRVADLLALLLKQLLEGLIEAGFYCGINADEFSFNPATAWEQRGIFKDSPTFFMALTHAFDQFKILRINVNTDIAGPHGPPREYRLAGT